MYIRINESFVMPAIMAQEPSSNDLDPKDSARFLSHLLRFLSTAEQKYFSNKSKY